jgi:hypothetical protein
MKRMILTTGLILAISLTSFARKIVAEGKTYSALGNYRIEMGNKAVMIAGKGHVPYVITYENSDLMVLVAIDMNSKGKNYYVISDKLSVKYVSNKHYFGVERLEKELEKDGYKTSESALNRVAYFNQKAITTGQYWRYDNTKLIAVFFPLLLNSTENVFAVK